MKIFECDVCSSPFKPDSKRSINVVELYYANIIDSDLNSAVSSEKMNMPRSGSSSDCFYHICPKCFNTLRDTLWSLRNKNKDGDQNE